MGPVRIGMAAAGAAAGMHIGARVLENSGSLTLGRDFSKRLEATAFTGGVAMTVASLGLAALRPQAFIPVKAASLGVALASLATTLLIPHPGE